MLDNHLQLDNPHWLNQFPMHVEAVYHSDVEFEDFVHTKNISIDH